MLKTIRKNVKKLGWPAAIMIILAFVLWGAPRLFKGEKAPTSAGTIFDQRVSFDEYYASLRACVRQARMAYRDKFDLVSRYLDIEGQAWDRLILLAEAKRQEIKISDDEVRGWIRSQPIFQTDGKFDLSEYRSLENPRAFEEEVRKNLAISKLIDSVRAQVTVTDAELRDEYEREFAKVRVSYVLVNKEDFEDEAIPTDEELKSYYDRRRQIFQIPVQVNVEYLSFDYADYENEVSITDEAVAEYYNAHLAEFKVAGSSDEESPVHRPLEEVKDLIIKRLTSIEAKKMAQDQSEEILDQLIEDPDLKGVAEENSLKVRETGFFTMEGPIPDIGFAPQLSVAAFNLEPGKISDPIYTSKGCYIIRLKEIKRPYIPSFEEAEAKVREIVTGSKAWELCLEVAKEYHSKLQEMMEEPGAKLEEVASLLSLDVKGSGLISRGDYIPGVGRAREFVASALSLSIGELSPPVKTEKGYAILMLKEHQPVDEEKLKASIDEYRAKVLDRKTTDAYNQWFNQLKQRANLKSNIR